MTKVKPSKYVEVRATPRMHNVLEINVKNPYSITGNKYVSFDFALDFFLEFENWNKIEQGIRSHLASMGHDISQFVLSVELGSSSFVKDNLSFYQIKQKVIQHFKGGHCNQVPVGDNFEALSYIPLNEDDHISQLKQQIDKWITYSAKLEKKVGNYEEGNESITKPLKTEYKRFPADEKRIAELLNERDKLFRQINELIREATEQRSNENTSAEKIQSLERSNSKLQKTVDRFHNKITEYHKQKELLVEDQKRLSNELKLERRRSEATISILSNYPHLKKIYSRNAKIIKDDSLRDYKEFTALIFDFKKCSTRTVPVHHDFYVTKKALLNYLLREEVGPYEVILQINGKFMEDVEQLRYKSEIYDLDEEELVKLNNYMDAVELALLTDTPYIENLSLNFKIGPSNNEQSTENSEG